MSNVTSHITHSQIMKRRGFECLRWAYSSGATTKIISLGQWLPLDTVPRRNFGSSGTGNVSHDINIKSLIHSTIELQGHSREGPNKLYEHVTTENACQLSGIDIDMYDPNCSCRVSNSAKSWVSWVEVVTESGPGEALFQNGPVCVSQRARSN